MRLIDNFKKILLSLFDFIDHLIYRENLGAV